MFCCYIEDTQRVRQNAIASFRADILRNGAADTQLLEYERFMVSVLGDTKNEGWFMYIHPVTRLQYTCMHMHVYYRLSVVIFRSYVLPETHYYTDMYILCALLCQRDTAFCNERAQITVRVQRCMS